MVSTFRRLIAVCLVFLGAGPASVFSQTSTPVDDATPVSTSAANPSALSQVRAALTDAKDRLQAENLPDRDQTRAAVLEAIDGVKQYFRRATGEENRQAWMRYLQLEPLLSAIEDEGSVAERGRAAVDLRHRLRAPEEGLELSALVRLREALDRYVAALQYGDPDRGLRLAEAQVDRLRELLEDESLESFNSLDAEATAKVEAIATSLEDAGQVPRLVGWLRAPFSHRNLHLYVAGEMITDAVARPVDEVNPVNDCILGTRVRGQSRLSGRVTAQLLPAAGQVRLLVRMDGQFTSQTRGYNSPVSIDSVSHGRVYVARQIAVLPGRMVPGETVATADLSTDVQRINHPLKLVRHIARREVARSKPKAEAIAEGRLRRRVEASFREGTDEAVSKPRRGVEQWMSPWLRRLNLPEPERTIGSTHELVYLHSTVRRREGFAAATEAPDLSLVMPGGRVAGLGQDDFTSVLQVHESVLSETLASVLAGREFTPADWKRFAGPLGALKSEGGAAGPEDPESFNDSEDQPDFEIDFANFRPIFFEARDQALRLGIRGTRFADGDRELDRTLQVTATYRPAVAEDGTTLLLRDESIDLSFPGGRRLTLAQTAIKANILEGFGKVFPEKLLYRPLPVPSDVELPSLQGRTFRPVAIDLRDGWFTVALR